MQIQIKNILKIKNAEVNLNWLTVIAWSNDTGKTTVWKLAFSVIKAFQRYREDFDNSKEKILESAIEKLYFSLRVEIRNIDKSGDLWSYNELLRKDFYPPVFLNELTLFWGDGIFENKETLIKNLGLEESVISSLLEKLDNIKTSFLKNDNRDDLIKKALKNILESEFNGQLNNNKINKKWTIILKEWEIELFKINIEWDKVTEVTISDDILRIKDTTFIDTPIILNLFNNLFSSIKFSSRQNRELQFHLRDLFWKIRQSKFEKDKKNSFWEKVENIIWWTFVIINKWIEEYLIFKKDWKEIETINIANWIKSFWLLDLLDRSHNLDETNLLILDEPESHLHPEWQVKYAEMIVSLIKERWLTVLITSHSPYLIEALNKYSIDLDITSLCSFYLSSINKDWFVIMEDKTNNQWEIFEKLSAPFEKLVWG